MQHNPPASARHAYAASHQHHQLPSPSPSRARFFPLPRSSSALNTPSPTSSSFSMGLSQSTARQSPPLPAPPVETAAPPPPPPSQKLKLAWPGRKKKGDDLNRTLGKSPRSPPLSPSGTPPTTIGKGTDKERELTRQDSLASQSDCEYSPPSSNYSHELSRTQSRQSRHTSARQFASNTLQALKGKLNASATSFHSPKSPTFSVSSPSPPPLPPKPEGVRYSMSSHSRSSADDTSHPPPTTADKHSSLPPPESAPAPPPISQSNVIEGNAEASSQPHVTGPEVSAAQSEDDVKPQAPMLRRRERREESDQSAREVVEDWRKSDSTLRTVRLVGAGAGVGNRTPRPLSLAESTNSNQTILPGAGAGSPNANAGANKRLSALMADVDFGMPEAESEESDDEVVFLRDAKVPTYGQAQIVNMSTESWHQQQPHLRASSRSPSPPSSTQSQNKSRRGSISFRVGRFSHSPSPPPGKDITHAHSQSLSHSATDNGSDSEALSSASASTHSHGIRTASSSTTSVSVASSSSPATSAKDASSLSGYSEPTGYSETSSVGIASSTSSSSGLEAAYSVPHHYQYDSKLQPWIQQPTPASASASESSISLATSNSSHNLSESAQNALSTVASNATDSSRLSVNPSSRPEQQRSRLASINSKGFRQTAVSLTSGFGPAAGFAKGFGRKAVDKLGRALGGSATNLSTAPPLTVNYYAPTYATDADAQNSPAWNFKMGRSQSNQVEQLQQLQRQDAQDQAQGKNRALRRTHAPNAPSGVWSITSGSDRARSSLSDNDSAHGHGYKRQSVLPPPRGSGPNLGRLMRSPMRSSGGLVFGRELSDCVRETAVESKADADGRRERHGSAFVMDMEVVGAKALEGRKLPALVMRCAQHIEKWGVQEEGLFRISGRATHVQKLRAEFDSGADYDMSECGPGEIDPHAVASVFKAYLRELPEPILTRYLIPYFDEAVSQENEMINAASESESSTQFERARGPGLPSGPKGGSARAHVRKAPSLSTFAVPTLTPRAHSEPLLQALAALIARLPQENRDLLRTLTELMRMTARRSKETKMPLSNLILVFCPTLQMSPPLLRVLCEGEGIWNGPPKGTMDPVVLDIKPEHQDIVLDIKAQTPEVQSTPEPEKTNSVRIDERDEQDDGEIADAEGESALRSQRTIRRAKRASHQLFEDASHQHTSTTAPQQSAPSDQPSLILTSPADTLTPSETSSSVGVDSSLLSNPYSPAALTNSSESLSTPVSSGSASAGDASITLVSPGATLSEKSAFRTQSDLPSPSKGGSLRKSMIGRPIPFPLGVGSAPVTPPEPVAGLRLSTHSSSPNLGVSTIPGSPIARRRSRPSLQGLFPKRSLSSLLGRASGVPPTPDSPSHPDNFATAPQSRVVSTACPVLELPVSTSPIKFGLDLPMVDAELVHAFTSPAAADSKNKGFSSLSALGLRSDEPGPMSRASSSNSSAVTSAGYYTPPTGSRPLPTPPTLPAPAPMLSSSNSTGSTGSYSLLDFDLSNGSGGATDDDWAKSVLQAADKEAKPSKTG